LDAPVAVAEVLTPQYEEVARFAVEPGMERLVDVPSEDVFLRVRLPSGRAVTLRHSGDLTYTIDRAALGGLAAAARGKRLTRGSGELHTLGGVQRYHGQRKAVRADVNTLRPVEVFGPAGATGATSVRQLADGTGARWEPEVPGVLSLDGAEIDFSPDWREQPYGLRLDAGGLIATLRLPGRLEVAYLRSDQLDEDRRLVSLRVSTPAATADAAAAFLARGDFYAAESLAPWAEQAEEMLQSKMRDPYGAAIGAYLLLRLERFDLMHDWARNLANWFEFLPDGCILWACQLLRQGGDAQEARKYLEKAHQRGLPVFTEGLRLLSQILPRMGDEGRRTMRDLSQKSGYILWSSPFTTRLGGTPNPFGPATTFDIGWIAGS
jgi:hypothetical protein